VSALLASAMVINERRYLSAAEVERLVAAIDHRYEALVLVAAISDSGGTRSPG
jgi:hypothetical protein